MLKSIPGDFTFDDVEILLRDLSVDFEGGDF